MSIDTTSPARRREDDAFPATQWSMVLRACSGDAAETEARAALESLFLRYWYPLYSFIRWHGHAHHEAEDCTQEFLARLLSTRVISRARPERGRFRSYLLTALQHFLTDEWRRAQAAKRGSGLAPLSLEFASAEERFSREPVDSGLTPDQVFDRSWAIEMLSAAIAGLRKEYERSGRGGLFTAIAPLALDDPGTESRADLAARLGMSVDACDVAVHRLRRRLAVHLRAGVAQTVAEEAEIDIELRHLIAAVSSPRAVGAGPDSQR